MAQQSKQGPTQDRAARDLAQQQQGNQPLAAFDPYGSNGRVPLEEEAQSSTRRERIGTPGSWRLSPLTGIARGWGPMGLWRGGRLVVG
jgi:hypothetical protein